MTGSTLPNQGHWRHWSSASKTQKFVAIIAVLVALGAILSFVARHTILAEDPRERSRIAVIAPLSGANAEIGRSMRQGVELYVEMVNARGGVRGHKLAALALDDEDTAAGAGRQAAEAAGNARVIGVVGHWSAAALDAAAEPYRAAGLCMISPGAGGGSAATGGCPPRTMGVPAREQARFLANYARNVMQQRLMYVVQEDSPVGNALAQPFVDTFEKFGIAVRQKWMIPPSGADSSAAAARIAKAIGELPDVGAVFVAASPAVAAKALKSIRGVGSHLQVFGPDMLASAAFLGTLADGMGGADGSAEVINGAVIATPLLLDTANEQAQEFKTEYQRRYGATPDWVAAYAFDAAKAVAAGLQRVDGSIENASPSDRRKAVAEALSAMNGPAAATQGVTGPLWFGKDGLGRTPIQMGIFNGNEIVSAPIQLQPISKSGVSNYIAELKAGRVLYVNDRFMYKTNVVYVGAKINEITDIDIQKETATVDFDIWFRYAGDFSPQDILVNNAAEPIKLDKPDLETTTDEVNYRRYHLRKKLFLDFSHTAKAFGTHVAGISFRHRTLNRSNLLYVVDVLGMPSGSALLADLADRRVISEKSGWKPARAWVSQEMAHENGTGEPVYIGYSGVEPQFSKIDLGVLLRPTGIEARDIIDANDFVYLLIFGVLGTAFAKAMDARRWSRYWSLQSWLIRLVFWPSLLLSAGNMALDFAFQRFDLPVVQTMAQVYACLWWLLPAVLADMAVRRFIWTPLEERSGRRIPNVLKIASSVIIIVLAAAGMVAFVFGQTLTSLLATSGLLAMIIGLAVQSNIANLFSGIILNIERPFKVGNWVRINNITGEIIDITWRTTRMECVDGQLVCFANAKVSEAEIHNFSIAPHGVSADLAFYTSTSVEPERVLDVLKEAANQAVHVINKGDPSYGPLAFYKGIESVTGTWVAKYTLSFRVTSGSRRGPASQEVYMHVRNRFNELDIPLQLGSTPLEPALQEA
jgi:ABC-type branched-subunit amino acid transport system substrate-binding protein/small-conductance mechanosensitive channel